MHYLLALTLIYFGSCSTQTKTKEDIEWERVVHEFDEEDLKTLLKDTNPYPQSKRKRKL